MKKFLLLLLLAFTALFVFSCASDDEELETIDDGLTDTTPGGNTGEDTDSGTDTTPEPDGNDYNSTDSDKTDSVNDEDNHNDSNDHEQPDTADSTDDTDHHLSDNGDSAPDENHAEMTDEDSVETADEDNEHTPDEDNGNTPDNDNEPVTGLPECSKNSDLPCEDSLTHLIWSEKTASASSWSSAKSYCEGKGEGWRLPTIDDLRTLVLGCDETATGGACGVKEGCLSESPCYSSTYCVSKNCPTRNDGAYSIFGDTCYLWSSSEIDGDSNRAWYLNFKFAAIGSSDKSTSDLAYTRCVKK